MAIPGGVAPIDLALGVALPVHSHIALNFVRVPSPLVLDPSLEIRVRSEAYSVVHAPPGNHARTLD